MYRSPWNTARMIRTGAVVLALVLTTGMSAAAHATKHGPTRPAGIGPMAVLTIYHWPSDNPGGGSHAYGTWGTSVLVQAAKPSPAAQRLCNLEVGDVIPLDGAVPSGIYKQVGFDPTPYTAEPWDVSVVVTDPSGTHRGGCSGYLQYQSPLA